MPLPMVHLAVAMQMHETLKIRPLPDFLLGSISPDAIHMRPGAGPAEKQRVHLSNGDDPQYERVRDLLSTYGTSDKSGLGFAAGYAAHLLTDRLWEQAIGLPFRASFPEDFDPKARRALYYQETDQIDFDLYHQVPWRSEVWTGLVSCEINDFAGLLSSEEISRWSDRTINWFEKLKTEPGIIPNHITRAQVDAYILYSAQKIVEIWRGWGVPFGIKPV